MKKANKISKEITPPTKGSTGKRSYTSIGTETMSFQTVWFPPPIPPFSQIQVLLLWIF